MLPLTLPPSGNAMPTIGLPYTLLSASSSPTIPSLKPSQSFLPAYE